MYEKDTDRPDGVVNDAASDDASAASVRRPIVLLGLGQLLLLIGYPVLVGLSGPYAVWVDGAFFVVVITAAIAATFKAYRWASETEKRFWLLLVAINVLTMVSQLGAALWLFHVAGDVLPVPSVFDLLNLAAVCCFVLFAGSFFRARPWTRSSATRHLLDAVSIATIAYGALAAFYVGPLLARYSAEWPRIAVSTAYPLMGAAIVTLLVVSGIGYRTRAWMPWERLLSAAMTVYGLGLLLWPLLSVTSDYVRFNFAAVVYALVFLSGHYLIFATAVVRLAHPKGQAIRSVSSRVRGHHEKLAVFVPLLALGTAITYGYIGSVGPTTPTGSVLRFTGLALLVLLAVRSSAVVYENAVLQQLVVSDPLTGLLDRRQLLTMTAEQVQVAQRYGDPVALMVMDLDGFAKVNARLGIRAGDEALEKVAHVVSERVRPGDMVFRAGDDEFAVLAADCTASQAMLIAEDIRGAIAELELRGGALLSASIGLAVFPEDALDHLYLLKRAEGAAYHAKTHGKNRTVRYDVTSAFDLSPKDHAERLQNESRLSTVRALAAAVDARDAATQYHSRNVARLCVAMGQHLALQRAQLDALETAALLHDIGKIGVADRILRKAGHLTAAERIEVQQHAALGERILAGTDLYEILPWIRAHHERWDGTGYPSGLAGEEIPLEARILSICDAYDAMTSDRPYRRALSSAAALQEIDLNMGTQFDPGLAEEFIAVVSGTAVPRQAEAAAGDTAS